MPPKRAIPLLGALALAAAVLAAANTRHGAGVTPDATSYIGAARNWLHGDGLRLWEMGRLVPLTTWPPLFPAVLAFLGLASPDPWTAARWLNAILFGGNVFLVGWLIYMDSRSSWPPVWGSLLALLSPVLLKPHTMAWSDPLFLFLGLLGFVLLLRYLENGKRWLPGASALAMALSFLTRYPGVVFVGAGALAVLLFGRGRLAKRLALSFAFGAVGCLPMAAWMVRNELGVGNPINRSMSFHPPSAVDLRQFVCSVASWLFPEDLFSGKVRVALFVAVVLGVGAIFLRGWRRHRTPIRGGRAAAPSSRLPAIMGLFSLLYVLFLTISISFWDANTQYDNRILLPVFMSALVAGMCLAARSGGLLAVVPRLQVLLAVLGGCVALLYLVSGARYTWDSWQDGREYASGNWTQSLLIGWVRDLPSGVPVYTNGPDVIDFLLHRGAFMVPAKVDPMSRRENLAYVDQMSKLKQDLLGNGAFLVYFDTITCRTFLPAEDELKRELPLSSVLQAPDGAVYRGKTE